VGAGAAYPESLRSLIRAISLHEKDILAACDSNQYNLSFLASQVSSDQAVSSEQPHVVDEVEDHGPALLEESEPVSDIAIEVIEPKKKRKVAVKKAKTVGVIPEEETDWNNSIGGEVAFELDRNGTNQPPTAVETEIDVRKPKKRKAKT
jgi:hypothetical protein